MSDNNKVAVYVHEERLFVLHPAQEFVDKYGMDVLCKRDIPPGVPYKIVDKDSLPTYDEFRMAWEVDESLLTDGIGSNSTDFDEIILEESLV
jgi:hypothetical protein